MLISASFMTALRAMAPVTAYCCLVFLYTGGTLPFMGLWFESRGLNSGQISLILALPMLARVVTGPLIAAWADRPGPTVSGCAGLHWPCWRWEPGGCLP